ncbi:MAG: hypothetical protein WDZ85_00085 [Candidatus Paceibacterota bacterium]
MIKFKPVNKQSGQAMILVVIFGLLVGLAIIAGIVAPTVRAARIASELTRSAASYYLAEAAVEDAVYRLRAGDEVLPADTLEIDGRVATIEVVDTPFGGGKKITIAGDWDEAIRRIGAKLVLGTGASFHYGIQSGNGGFQIDNGAVVHGNIFSNGAIQGANNAEITGSAISVVSINNIKAGDDVHAPEVTNSSALGGTLYCQTGSGNNQPCNTSLDNPESQDYPLTEEMINGWKEDAEAGGVITGDYTPSGSSSSLGPVKIEGNLHIPGGHNLTIDDTVWVTGNITTGTNPVVRLNADYGPSGGIFMADGSIDISNNAVFEGSGEASSYILLLTTSSADPAIRVANNTDTVILNAQWGVIQFAQNAGANEAVAYKIHMLQNAEVFYISGLANLSFISGPGGTFNIFGWGEE